MKKDRIKNFRTSVTVITIIVFLVGAFYWLLITENRSLISLWLTPDQQGDRLMKREQYSEAAEVYTNLFRKGVAYFLAGEFKDAARAFGRVKTPEADFNKGNALVMQGKYTEAVVAYETALDARPDWIEAKGNREIALLRAERVKKEGGEMTGGKLEADDFVFTAGKKTGEGEEEVTDDGNPLSDEALQALWLRRIQTKPADFLRAKFAYQAHQGGSE